MIKHDVANVGHFGVKAYNVKFDGIDIHCAFNRPNEQLLTIGSFQFVKVIADDFASRVDYSVAGPRWLAWS